MWATTGGCSLCWRFFDRDTPAGLAGSEGCGVVDLKYSGCPRRASAWQGLRELSDETAEGWEIQVIQVNVSSNRNKARVLEMVDRVMNGHDVSALSEFASNPSVIGSGTALVNAFPDLAATVRWIVAEDDIVSMYLEIEGTHRGPWIWVQEPSGNRVAVGMMLAFRFDEDGLMADQWLGGNFVAMLQQMGWGVAPVGQQVPPGA